MYCAMKLETRAVLEKAREDLSRLLEETAADPCFIDISSANAWRQDYCRKLAAALGEALDEGS